MKKEMKKSVHFGLNYKGTECELNGCHNDCSMLQELFDKKGYETNVYLDNNPVKCPTRQKIMEVLEASVSDLREGDTLVITYSGHGSKVRDTNGDEISGYDSTIVPADYEQCGMVLDDEIREVLNKAPAGSRVFCLFDSCHSGTCVDLRFNFFLPEGKVKIDERHKETNADVWLVSGCTDKSTSSDIRYNGKYNGALTVAFLASVKKATSMVDLVCDIRQFIKDKKMSDQVPQLSSGKVSYDVPLFF